MRNPKTNISLIPLPNIGNTCFLNASLRLVYHILQTLKLPSDVELYFFIQQVFQSSSEGAPSLTLLQQILALIDQQARTSFGNGQAHDASLFSILLIRRLGWLPLKKQKCTNQHPLELLFLPFTAKVQTLQNQLRQAFFGKPNTSSHLLMQVESAIKKPYLYKLSYVIPTSEEVSLGPSLTYRIAGMICTEITKKDSFHSLCYLRDENGRWILLEDDCPPIIYLNWNKLMNSGLRGRLSLLFLNGKSQT